MQFTTAAVVLAFAGAAVAQTGCQAQNILDACTAQYQPRLQSCFVQDYDCQCSESQNLLTCYANCPNDPKKSSVQSQVTQYCGAAKVYGSSASLSNAQASTSSGGSATVASLTSTESPTLPAGVSASSSSTAASRTSGGSAPTSSTINGSGSGSGNVVGVSVGGLVLALAGAVALL